MKRITRPAFFTNTTLFTFEGYLSKIVYSKRDGEIEKVIGAKVSFGSNKYGRIWVSLKNLQSNVNHLEEGKPYTFSANVGTRYNTELDYIHVVSAHPIEEDREPFKSVSTRVVGRVIEEYQTVKPGLSVVKFECQSDNRQGKETYMCRVGQNPLDLTEGLWTVDLELRQNACRLFWENEERTIFDGEIESEEVWVKEKDSEGKVIMLIDEKGELKPSLRKREIDIFHEIMCLNPISKVSETE